MKAVGLEESALRRYRTSSVEASASASDCPRFGPPAQVHRRDEPVSALDVSVGAQIVNLLAQLQRDFGLTYLLFRTPCRWCAILATRIAVMYRGKIVEIDSTEQITTIRSTPTPRSC